MAIKRNGTATKYAFLHNGTKLKKGYHNGEILIWSAGGTVTYHVGAGITYVEEKDDGADILTPLTFTPVNPIDSAFELEGWTLGGDSIDTLLTEGFMDSDNIHLYAAWKKKYTIQLVSGANNSIQELSEYMYVRCKTDVTSWYSDPMITLPSPNAISGWTAKGWTAFSDDQASNNDYVSAGYEYNASGDYTKLYALYETTVTKTFVSYNNTEKVTGKRYFNAAGNYANPTITVPTGATYSGWTWRGWTAAEDTGADATVSWDNGSAMQGATTDSTYYGLYNKTVTRTFHSMNGTSNKSESVSGTAYYNASGTTAKAAIVVPSGGTYTGWTWRGWSGLNSTAADASVVSESGKTIYTLDDGDVYGLYQQTITLSYNGNSADSGSVENQSGTSYYNAYGKTKNPSFYLATNGFTRNNYKWIAWAQGSASGTQYAVGAGVTLSANTTFYAVWERISTPYYAIQSGAIIDCPNAVAEQQGGHSNSSGAVVVNGVSFYGSYGHTTGSDSYNDYWGAYTGNLSTEGCSKLSFTLAMYEQSSGAEVREYYVYGDGVEIEHETIGSGTDQVWTTTRTVDVSNYSTVAVRVRVQDSNYSNSGYLSDTWMGAGFIEVRLHD